VESISIPASVETLGEECFACDNLLSPLAFESGSKIVRIHSAAFSSSPLLKSIVISGYIRELARDWALGSSLKYVIFESAASLQRMLDCDCVDLAGHFMINIGECDSDIDSLATSIGRRFKHFSHLVQSLP
jgi:hypothetical protein